MNLNKKQLKRFWNYIDKKNRDSCWEWKSYKGTGGYGKFYHNNKQHPAHKVSWILHFGPFLNKTFEGQRICVCHKCDNPSCVNPYHLFLGTDMDNMKDRDRKNRLTPYRPSGSKNGNANISLKVCNEIKHLTNNGLKNVDIAKKMNVSEALVSLIKNDKHWSQKEKFT